MVSLIVSLRRLVDLQQFSELAQAAERYLAETNDQQALPLLALAHANLGERTESIRLCQRLEDQLEQLDSEARIDLAGVYCVLQRVDDALSLLQKTQEAHPENALLQARLAWCYMAKGEPHQALEFCRRSVKLAPHRLPVWNALIGLYLREKDFYNAQQSLDKAIDQFGHQYDDLSESVQDFFSAQLRQLQLELWVATENQVQAEEWLEQRRDDIEENDWTQLTAGYAALLASHDKHDAAIDALNSALKHYPQSLNLISQQAELAQVLGRHLQSAQLLRRAIRFAKEQGKQQVILWVRLSAVCLIGMPERARKAAEQAIEQAQALQEDQQTSSFMIKQLQVQAKNALAQVESQEQNYDLAETLFNQILDDNPYFLPALSGLGQLQMQCGNIDTAIELFERIKEIDPAKGYSSLINARRFPDDVETLNRMEKVARQPGLEGSVKSGLLLQIASAYEKRKVYDKAFELAVEGNDVNKARLNYDPKAHRNQCARIRARFSKALFQHRKECGSDSSLPVFVLGMPRSGTTLVEQIISGHSKIFGAGELGVIPARKQGLERWERHVGSGRTYPDCVDDISPYLAKKISDSIITELKELAAEDKPDAIHVVDKLPHNFEHVGLIKFLFPNAKIISVRRDPRDIAISNYFTDYQAKFGGMGFAYDLTWIGEQLADHNLLMHHWNQVFPGEILELNYEDVVEDLEGSARTMLKYIGVEWEDQVLGFNELDRPVKTASVWQVRQPIYKTSKAKWKHYQRYLKPLIKGTNAKIVPDPITDMLTLPEPGFLQDGVALFQDNKLDEAEMSLKKMLHHNPEHAAANYMVGLIYCRKGHIANGIELLEKALDTCPWQKDWRDNLILAYEETGEHEKAALLRTKVNRTLVDEDLDED
ncbi:sulfotransferase [Vibrio sp. RC27]